MAKLTKEIEYNGMKYTLATITTGVYKKLNLAFGKGTTMGELVVASLMSGGHDDAQAIYDNLPMFNDTVVSDWCEIAREVNGLKLSADPDKPGEVKAEPVPAVQ